MLLSFPQTEAIEVERWFPATPAAVFKAWTDPDEFVAWWRPGPYRIAVVEMDPRPGGRYQIVLSHPDGGGQTIFGTYQEVDPPHKLVMTWSIEGSLEDDGYVALLTLTFRPATGGTTLFLRHDRLPETSVGMYRAGWSEMLGHLASHLG